MPEEPAAAADVRAALGRTVSRGTARIELRCEFPFDFETLKGPRTRRPSGLPVRRLMARLGGALVRVSIVGAMRLVMHWLRKGATQSAAGVIDFVAQRCMYADPSSTTLVVGDRMWRGPSGTAVSAVAADPASTLQPLWLIDLVRGVVAAREQTPEVLDGRSCRRFSAHADLTRVAEAVPYELAIPSSTGRLGELKQIPVDVWVDDDGCIRRIRHVATIGVTPSLPTNTTTVDLIEFGIEPPADWSRLSTVLHEPTPGAAQGG